jgi:hypothetical protein
MIMDRARKIAGPVGNSDVVAIVESLGIAFGKIDW